MPSIRSGSGYTKPRTDEGGVRDSLTDALLVNDEPLNSSGRLCMLRVFSPGVIVVIVGQLPYREVTYAACLLVRGFGLHSTHCSTDQWNVCPENGLRRQIDSKTGRASGHRLLW